MKAHKPNESLLLTLVVVYSGVLDEKACYVFWLVKLTRIYVWIKFDVA